MPSDDPQEWLPQLLNNWWGQAVDALRAEGKGVSVTDPPTIAGANQRKAAGTIRNHGRVKVYRVTRQTSEPQSWGDTDRDVTVQYAIHVQAAATNAEGIVRSAEAVIDRILAMHRCRPHDAVVGAGKGAWDRFESWSADNPENHLDYQLVVFIVILARRGEVLPVPIRDR